MPTTTPGHTWVDGETVTYAKLRSAAAPTVVISDADVTAIAKELGAASAGINWLKNPDFRTKSSLASSVALPEATWTEHVDHWKAFVQNFVSAPCPPYVIYERDDDAVHDHVLYCLKFTGAENASQVSVGQELSAQVAAAILEGKATLTIELENRTGSAQVPRVIFKSCDTFENYNATTERLNIALASIASNARTTYTQTIDLTGLESYVRNGGRLYVQMPGIDSAAKEWLFYYCRLEPGETATPRRIARDEVSATSESAAAASANYLQNPDFSEWITASRTCTAGADNVAALAWNVIPTTGSDGIASRSVDSPDVNSLYSLLFTGSAATLNAVDFVQDLPREQAGPLRTPLVFSVEIYNGTGAAFEPNFILDSCNAENSTARTSRINQPLDTCANGAWTLCTWEFNGEAITNFANGARLGIRIPTGSLDGGGKTVKLAQARLTIGEEAVSWTPQISDNVRPLASTAATTPGLAIAYASATTITVAATSAICEKADGTVKQVRNVSVTASISSTGANALDTGTVAMNTFYAVRIIANGETAAALLHVEGATPVLPAGYQWISGVVGVVRTNGSSQVPVFYQRGPHASIEATAIRDDFPLADDTWEIITIAGGANLAIPATAIAVHGSIGVSTNTNCRVSIAPTSTGIGRQTLSATAAGTAYLGFNGGAAPFSMPLVTAQTLYMQADNTSLKTRCEITGFDLP